jgi:hypothetical protein
MLEIAVVKAQGCPCRQILQGLGDFFVFRQRTKENKMERNHVLLEQIATILSAAGQEAYARAMQRRSETPVGDIVGAVRTMVVHYEVAGTRLLRALAQEERDPQFHAIVDAGRVAHRQWVERVFAPFLVTHEEQKRERLLAQLVAITDVYTWKLLRRDSGLSREQTELALQEMIEALYERKE